MSDSTKLASSTSVALKFRHDATKEQIFTAIQSVFDRYGCRACGIAGRYLVLSGDPDPGASELRYQLLEASDKNGVTDVGVFAGGRLPYAGWQIGPFGHIPLGPLSFHPTSGIGDSI